MKILKTSQQAREEKAKKEAAFNEMFKRLTYDVRPISD